MGARLRQPVTMSDLETIFVLGEIVVLQVFLVKKIQDFLRDQKNGKLKNSN